MRYACSGKIRLEPQPGSIGDCQICGNKVKAFCGKVNRWHWRHNKLPDCDTFHEPMTEWHRSWQNQFPKEWREVVLERNNEKHFADILTPSNLVIEFQHSSISQKEISERELFYNCMVWVIDAVGFKKNLKITDLSESYKETLRNEYDESVLQKKISNKIEMEISSLELEKLDIENLFIRNPRSLERKKQKLQIYEKTLMNLDRYLLNEAIITWLENGRILYDYSENLDMDEIEIRKQLVSLQLEGNCAKEKIEMLKNEKMDKKRAFQEIYNEVKLIFSEGLPNLINKKQSEILKIEERLPKIKDEIVSKNLSIKRMKQNKEKRILDFLANKRAEFRQKIAAVEHEYGNIFSYKWRNRRKSWDVASKPLFLDTGDDFLYKIKSDTLLVSISKVDFIRQQSNDRD